MLGLAMLLPLVGFPLAFLVLGGATLTGAGFFAISSALTPFSVMMPEEARRKDNVQAGKVMPAGNSTENIKQQ